MHIHLRKAGAFAKFWVEPIGLAFAQGLKVKNVKIAEELVNEHLDLIKQEWHEIHGS